MNFDQACDRVLGFEDGYVNDPNDPGGETKWGISKRSYPNEDIANLTRDQAKAIYLRDFWAPLAADGLAPALQFQVFDFAVNSGISTAIRKLQTAIGVADDGHWGPISAAALAKSNQVGTGIRFVAEEIDFKRRLSTFRNFGSGWMGRAAQDLRYFAGDIAS